MSPPNKLKTGQPFIVAVLLFPACAQHDLTGSPDLAEPPHSAMKPVSARQAAAIEIARLRLAREAAGD